MIHLPDWSEWNPWRWLRHFDWAAPLFKYGLGLATGTGAYGYKVWRQKHRRGHAASWIPLVPPICAALTPKKIQRGRFLVEIMYEYDVQSHRYEGRHYEILKGEEAAETLRRNVNQTRLTIWYNPQKPGESVLDEMSLSQVMPGDLALMSGK